MKRTARFDREFVIELSALVVGWLNGAVRDRISTGEEYYRPSALAQGRIECLLDLIKTLESLSSQDDSRIQSLTKELDGLFSQYPAVFRCLPGNPLLPSQIWRIHREPIGGTFDRREADVVENIVELARNGAANKIRRCLCGRWYFSKKSDHSSCSINCRKSKHESTPEYREKRAARARENRAVRERGYGTRTSGVSKRARKR